MRGHWAAGAAAAFLLAAAAATPAAAGPQTCRAAAPGQDSYCQVDGARLHFVDWGGEGPPLILLAGFGDSARIFDELAPMLAQKRRVYAFTRRGFGGSQPVTEDFRAERFAQDVLAMMDALGIAKADIVGHSVAGAEMVLVAKRHPERVRRLVYLDAAYDRSDALALEAAEPTPRRPPPAALTSPEAFAAWRSAALGVRSPAVAANVRQTMQVEAGRMRPATTPEHLRAIAGGGLMTVTPDYAAIAAPSLAIYAPKDKGEQLPPEATPDQAEASRAYALRRIRPWMLREQARFLETAPCGAVLEPAWASHYLFLEKPDWAARTILDFLDAEQPCLWSGARGD